MWEYTCFCAIDPARRRDYVRAVAALLRPGGWLLACFFPLRTAGRAPFPVSAAEVRRLFTPPFRIERAVAPRRSAPGRQGREWMVLARLTGAPA